MMFTIDITGVWIAASLFGAAICLLDSFDISLPRGDALGVSGALVASGFLVMGSSGPALMTVLALLGLVIAHAVRQKGLLTAPLGVALGIRVVALAVLWAVLAVVRWSGAAFSPALVAILAAGSYLGTELVAAQILLSVTTRRPLGRLLRGNINRQTPIIAAQVSVSALVVVTYRTMGAYSLLPVVAMLLLIRQSYALLLQMRETYRMTVEVLAEAAEGQDPRLQGHAERTAHIARAICMRLGMSASHVERASYAALLHDVDTIGQGFGEDESPPNGSSSKVLDGVAFLSDVIPVMRLCDGLESDEIPRESDLLIAMAVALSSEIDALRVKPVAAAHGDSIFRRVSERVTGTVKARVVSAALELGYEIPAVS